ncbi:MAG: type II toxin-antitoxin system HicA family toxin [Kiritimatiellota bacterium]|nr:type II toxin-antitoxin system HicA family toxin [Kiritimatiellota bacterium]
MPKPPLVSGKEAVKALQRLGFVFIRQKGSHAILRRETADGARGCVVPMHREIQSGTLRGILKQAGVDVQDFIEQL